MPPPLPRPPRDERPTKDDTHEEEPQQPEQQQRKRGRAKTAAADKPSPHEALAADVGAVMSAAQAADALLDEMDKQLGISEEAQNIIREHMVKDAQAAARAIAWRRY